MSPLHALHGREEVTRALARAVGRDGLPSALLIHGAPGVGKQRLALWIGQLLLCGSAGPEGPCGGCKGCRLALRLEHPDLHWYFPLPRPKGSSTPEKLAEALEEARMGHLAEIREAPLRPPPGSDEATGIYLAVAQSLRRRAWTRPSMGPRQVFVVARAEALVPQESSPEAANALLKLLEEPPSGTWFVLTSDEPGQLLPTIVSRSVPLHLPPLPVEEVARFLVEVAGAPEDAATLAARLSHGAIGRALAFLPDRDGGPGPAARTREEAWSILNAALGRGRGEGFAAALGFRPVGARALLDLFAHLEVWVRDLAAVAAGSGERVINVDRHDDLVGLAASRSVEARRVTEALAIVDQASLQARGNVNPQLVIAGLVAALRRTLLPPERSTEPARPVGAGGRR